MSILRPVPESDKLFDHLKGHLLFSIFPEETVLRCYDQSPSPVKRRTRRFTPQLVFLLILMSILWPRESLQRHLTSLLQCPTRWSHSHRFAH